MDNNLVLTARFVVGLTWLYEGLWLKILRPSAEELRVLETVFNRLFGRFHVASLDMLHAIGSVETMLAIGILAGWNPRLLAGIQILLLLGMDGAGIALGRNTLADPFGLVIKNLSFLVCILLVGLYDNQGHGNQGRGDKRPASPRAKRKPAAE